MKNPFENLVPRDNELLINEQIIKDVSTKIKDRVESKRLIMLEGPYGSGKTLYLNRLFDRLKTKKQLIEFNDVIVTVLEGKVPVKNKSLFINNFDLLQGLTDDQIYRLTEAMIKLLDQGMIILTGCRKDTLKKLHDINPLIRSKINRIKIPSLTYEEARDFIIARLNEARKKETDDLSPFTQTELRSIWHKVKGNPRLLLLILSPLYEQRMMIKE